jgi:FkbM family methyltransferase
MGLRTILGLKKPKDASYLNESYSQEGEDNILNRIFEHQKDGFFIDVGAHHPIRFSNTYKFYKIGWRGINIDAMPGSMEAFKTIRPEDVNLEVPVSDVEEDAKFYIFNEPAINTFSEQNARELTETTSYKIEKVVTIHTKRLDTLLDQYLPARQSINFMSIDAEGYDHKILLSNNWEKYRPKIVLIESELDLKYLDQSPIYQFMQANQYEFYAKTVKTYFYKDIRTQ